MADARRGRRRVHRRPADARGSRRRGRTPNYPAADPGAQLPAGRPADARTFLPVRAFAGRRRARRGALHRRDRQAAAAWCSTPKATGVRVWPRRSTKNCARPADYLLGQASFGGTTRNDFSAQHHAGAAHRRQPRAPPAHPGHHRPEARVRAAPPPRHPVHLRAQPAAARRACCVRSCVSIWPATFPPTRLGDAYEPHPTANQEIDGMMFPDMPWMLGDDGSVGRSARSRAPGVRRFRGPARPAVRLRLRRFSHRRRRCNAAPPSIRRGSPAHCRSTRRDACAANSSGCASRMACRRRSSAGHHRGRSTALTLRCQSRRWHGSPSNRARWPKTARAHFLESQGFTIVARNFLRRVGELDVVARAGDLLVVAEVRTRASDDSAAPRPASAAASNGVSPPPPHCSCSARPSCAAAACGST